VILTAHIREAFWWEISERVWQKLSPEIRAAFENNIEEAIKRANEWEFAEDAKYLADFAAKGVNVVELSKDELGEFSKLMDSVAKDYADKGQAGLYEEIVKLR